MEPNTQQSNIEKFDIALANTPEEVRAFLWSDAYKNLLSALQKKFGLTDEQKNSVDTIIFGSLTKTESEEELEKKVVSLGLEEQKRDELLSYVFTYFIEPSINKTEETFELEKKEEAREEKVVTVPNPAQALASIQERLSQRTTIAPTKRDYSVEKPLDSQIVTETIPVTPKRTGPDPYKEIPEE